MVGSSTPSKPLNFQNCRIGRVPLDKNEGVVKIDFFAAMLCSTAWISERWRTEALKLSQRVAGLIRRAGWQAAF